MSAEVIQTPLEFKQTRQKLKLSQSQLARKLKMTRDTISRWENSRQSTPFVVYLLMSAWEEHPDTFFDLTKGL